MTARLIGIDNRKLRSVNASLNTTLDLLKYISENHFIVTKSTVNVPADVKPIHEHQTNVFLAGQAFIRTDGPGEKLIELFSFYRR